MLRKQPNIQRRTMFRVGRRFIGLYIGVFAVMGTEPVAADPGDDCQKMAILVEKQTPRFEKVAKQSKQLKGIGKLAEFCDFGKKVAVPTWERVIAELEQASRFNMCFDDSGTGTKLLRDHRRGLDRVRRTVVAGCRYSEAIRQEPKDAQGFYVRGMAYYDNDEQDRAIADFTEVIRLDPSFAMAFHKRGMAYYEKGDTDRAIANFNEAVRLDPKYGGNPALINGDNEGDIAYNSEAIKRDPKDVQAFGYRGRAYLLKHDYDFCIRDTSEAIRLDPKQTGALSNRGFCYLHKGQLDRAISDFDEAIRLSPKFQAPYSNRGIAQSRRGDLDRALADLNQAILLEPKDKSAYAYRGLVNERKGQLENAKADFRKALALPINGYDGPRVHEIARARLAALSGAGPDSTATAPDLAGESPPDSGPASAPISSLPHLDESKFGVTYYGAIAPPDDPTYVAIRNEVAAREGPGTRWPSRFALILGAEVTAIGKFVDERCELIYYTCGGAKVDYSLVRHEREWIKILTKEGHQGFVHLKDIVTPKQFEARQLLIAYFQRAKKATGELSSFAGVYVKGGSAHCDDPEEIFELEEKYGGSNLIWSEGGTLYSVSIRHPEKVDRYKPSLIGSRTFDKLGPVNEPGTMQAFGLSGTSNAKEEKMTFFKFSKSGRIGFLYKAHFSTRCDTLAAEERRILQDYYPN